MSDLTLINASVTPGNKETRLPPIGILYLASSLRAKGYKVELKDFVVDYDPGTRNAASYKSVVRVEGKESTIQMNEPLYKNGYTFFQASFGESENGPTVSVLSVARDPGITLKYVGSILLVLGIAIMFYMKPYMIRKPKAREDS